MRRAYIVSSGKLYSSPCYETTATLWTTAGTSVTRDVNGTDTAMVANGGVLGEKAPRAGITQTS
jgi:hypothetical protein